MTNTDLVNFWSGKALSTGAKNFNDRFSNIENSSTLYSTLRSPYMDDTKNILSLVSSKQESASTAATISSEQSTTNDPDAQSMLDDIKELASLKYIESFYAQYMSDTNSDMLWRLGEVAEKYEVGDDVVDDDSGVRYGQAYSRSDFLLKYYTTRMNMSKGYESIQYYANIGFPPFLKSSELNKASKISKADDEFSYDHYMTTPGSLMYREPAFKQINDYITFVQRAIALVTGIDSTVLSDWDLSVYMQEKMIGPTTEGNYQVSINHGITDDNPGALTGDAAYVYNVTGCAVSKMWGANEKIWEPSNHPESPWWLPKSYSVNVYSHTYTYTDDDGNDVTDTYTGKYLSCFDVDPKFTSSMSMLDVINTEDAIRDAIGCKHTNTLHYYDAFYTSKIDGLTQADVSRQNFIDKAAGLKPSSVSTLGVTMGNLINTMKADNIADGGFLGTCSAANSSQGTPSKEVIKDWLEADGLCVENSTDVGEYYSEEDKCESTSFAGLNRFANPLFGGPHSKEYDPSSYRAMFDGDSQLLRNIPRIGYYPSSLITNNYYGPSKRYYNSTTQEGQSPNAGMTLLKKGLCVYEYKKLKTYASVTKWIESDVKYNSDSGYWEFSYPTTKNGQTVTYASDAETGTCKKSVSLSYSQYAALKPDDMLKKQALNTQSSGGSEGGGGYTITIVVPKKKGSYLELKKHTVRIPMLWNRPKQHWYIRAYDLDKFKLTETNSVVESSLGKGIVDHTWSSSSKKTAFILDLGSTAANTEFIDHYLMPDQNKTSPTREIYFCAGNKKKRFSDGPDSIFRAPVSVIWYKTTSWKIFRLHILWWTIKIPYGWTKRKHPLITVDLLNATDYYSGLQNAPQSNKDTPDNGGPVHLNNDFSKTPSMNTYYHSPIQEMTQTNASTIHAVHTVDGVDCDEWSATNKYSLEGYGLVTQLPGIEGQLEDVIDSNGTTYSYSSVGLFSNDGIENVPFNQYKASGYTGWLTTSERKDKNPEEYRKYKKDKNGLININYAAKTEYDSGLMLAWTRACTRSLFMPCNLSNATGGIWIDSSVPYRNMVSALYETLSGVDMLKDVVAVSKNLGVMKKIILNCVDPCVCAANGYLADGSSVDPDTNSIFYDFWLAEFIKMVKNPTASNTAIDNEITSLRKLIDASAESLGKYILKDFWYWTYSEVKTADNLMKSLNTKAEKVSSLDKFVMGYLKILYYWRLYFVGKRFNKTDGTMWGMRALESTINLITKKTSAPDTLSSLGGKTNVDVAFYRLDNTPSIKKAALLNGTTLEADKHQYVYVKVEYGDETAYNNYLKDPSNYERITKVVHNGVTKYPYVPADGTWSYISNEYLKDAQYQAWNKLYPNDTKACNNLAECKFDIKWGPDYDTPIIFDLFNNIDVLALIEYAGKSLSGNDLVCLSEDTADFWQIEIPNGDRPLDTYWQTGLKLVQKWSVEAGSKDDLYAIMLGPLAHTISPIGDSVSYSISSSIENMTASIIESAED